MGSNFMALSSGTDVISGHASTRVNVALSIMVFFIHSWTISGVSVSDMFAEFAANASLNARDAHGVVVPSAMAVNGIIAKISVPYSVRIIILSDMGRPVP